jgi:hypothetical protein
MCRHAERPKNVYVIPLCRACNDKHGQEMVIFDGVNLVSINWNVISGRKQQQEQDVTGRKGKLSGNAGKQECWLSFPKLPVSTQTA